MVGRSPAGAAGVPDGGGDGAVWTEAVEVVVADVGLWCLPRRLADGRVCAVELVAVPGAGAAAEPTDWVECDEEPHPASASAAGSATVRLASPTRGRRLNARPCIEATVANGG